MIIAKHDRKRTIQILNGIAKILSLLLLLLLAIMAGKYTGDFLYYYNKNLVPKFNTQSLKSLLNTSIPVIDTVYDTKSAGLKGELGEIIKSIFEFEISSPVTLISSESAIFKNYYFREYLPMLAQLSMEPPSGISGDFAPKNTGQNDNTQRRNGSKDDTSNKDGRDSGSLPGGYSSNTSSLYFEEKEEKDESKSSVIEGGEITLCNQTKYSITQQDIQELLQEPLKQTFSGKGPQVLIYHTHTTESYLRTIAELDKPVAAYTMDTSHSVVNVGMKLSDELEDKYGIDVLHNTTIHNYPDHYKAYSEAQDTLEKYLKSYPSIKLSIDIHRDAAANNKLRVVKEVEGKKVARVMFVVGTDEYGLSHPQWRENLKLAIKLQQSLNIQCPGLAKHIYITPYRYNQHMADNSILIEVGGDGNTIQECLESVQYLARAINDVMNATGDGSLSH